MISISLCMIVRNEEDVLGRCLDSVKDLVDEIIIVDTGSADRTKEIAKRYTSKIYEFSWIDDFAAARNFSFSKAVMDYQMWLDADDLVLPEDQELFRKMKEELAEDTDLVMLPYQAAFDEEGRSSMTYYRERLLRRECLYHWQGAVHEVIVPSGKIVYGNAAVSHKKLHPSDPDRNLRIYEKLLQKGERLDPRHQFYYGRELYFHSRYEEAADILRNFLQEGNGWLENNIEACINLSECYENLKMRTAALDTLFHSFYFDRPRAEVCCAVGKLFQKEKRYHQAIFWYHQAPDCEVKIASGAFVRMDCYNFIPAIELSVCYDQLGERENALKYHEKAKQMKPNHPSVIYNERYFYKNGSRA